MTYIVSISVQPARPKRKPIQFHFNVQAICLREALLAAIIQAKEAVPTRKVVGHPRAKALVN